MRAGAGGADVPRRRRTSWVFALVMMVGYGVMTLPILARHNFDSSVFIIAGDRFVDSGQLVSPIIVQPRSDGYDGQFYYRLALAPFQLGQPAFGIRFDRPVGRMQRIIYPLLAWAAAFGRPPLVPAMMFLINLLGLGASAMFGVRLAVRLRLPASTPLAIMLWPGFMIALTHDTTEIVAAALLLGALDFYFTGRLVFFGVLGALATLTRETSVLVLGGIMCFEMAGTLRQAPPTRRWRRVLVCGMTLVPLPLWWGALHLVWGGSPRESAGVRDVGISFVGAVTMLRDMLAGVRQLSPIHRLDFALRAFGLGGAVWLLGFSAMVLARVPAALRDAGRGHWPGAGWPGRAHVDPLTAGGPWIEPTAYFRAFTECYVVGCLLLALRPMPRWLAATGFAGGALALIGAWGLSVLQIG